MKDRITRTKALLDFTQLVQFDCISLIPDEDGGQSESRPHAGVLIVKGGPNGMLIASCAAILGMTYRLWGEHITSEPTLMQLIGGAEEIGEALMSVAVGSIIIVNAENVEEYASDLRDYLEAHCEGNHLVATCHS